MAAAATMLMFVYSVDNWSLTGEEVALNRSSGVNEFPGDRRCRNRCIWEISDDSTAAASDTGALPRPADSIHHLVLSSQHPLSVQTLRHICCPPLAFAVKAVSSAQSPDGRVCQGRINLESIRPQTSQRGVSANRRRRLPVTKTALAKASLVTQSLVNVTQSPLNGFGLTPSCRLSYLIYS